MGGWASLLTAAETDVLGAASIAAFNIGALAAAMSQAPDVLDQIKEVFGPQMGPLAGVDLGALFREAVAVGDRWDVDRKPHSCPDGRSSSSPPGTIPKPPSTFTIDRLPRHSAGPDTRCSPS